MKKRVKLAWMYQAISVVLIIVTIVIMASVDTKHFGASAPHDVWLWILGFVIFVAGIICGLIAIGKFRNKL